jgi:hypothetical protein
MKIYDLLSPEKLDMVAYDHINDIAGKIKTDPSLAGLAASMETELPTVLAAALYHDKPDPEDGGPGATQLIKWNDAIREMGLCGFAPYPLSLLACDTSVQSVWATIAQFIVRSRKAGATVVMIRTSLPEP